MSGLSPRNLKYMRAFAAAWPDLAIVQRALHKLPWGVNLELLDALKEPAARLWYAERASSMAVRAFQFDRPEWGWPPSDDATPVSRSSRRP